MYIFQAWGKDLIYEKIIEPVKYLQPMKNFFWIKIQVKGS